MILLARGEKIVLAEHLFEPVHLCYNLFHIAPVFSTKEYNNMPNSTMTFRNSTMMCQKSTMTCQKMGCTAYCCAPPSNRAKFRKLALLRFHNLSEDI